VSTTRIGLMGFGRIGRNLFRILYDREDLEIAGICDVADHTGLEYLLRYDTILGQFPDELSIRDGNLYVVGKQIPMLRESEPGVVDWRAVEADVVVEATASTRNREELERHLENGAERVVLCVPPSDPPDLTVIFGLNDHLLRPEHRIVSNGSCTAHAVAPVVKILHDAFGIERAFLSTIHAYTNQQRLADVPAKDKRRGRAAAENIIPQSTNVARMLEGLMPDLAGRLSAISMNVPVPNGSVVDLVCWHAQQVTPLAVNEVVRTAIASRWQGILDYEESPVVSSDIVRTPYSGTFDSLGTMAQGRVSKTLTWFDNGWGYAHRVVDLIQRLATLEEEAA
jgi:glyceraldehyde 3-phosphate dehydrogenase